MEVNTMLCVGRGRLSQFGKTHLSESGFRTPERKSSPEINNGTGLTEKELVARVSSKLSQDCLSPPTKSILRGRVPSPKQGSPSSLRSVRFSDKESDDEIMYAKIHVNKNIQTEHIHRAKTQEETGPGQGFKLDFGQNFEEFNPKGVHEMKTSTPRCNAFDGSQSLDFQTPRGRQEDGKSMQKMNIHENISFKEKSRVEITQGKQKSDNKHERIVFDIDIDRKRPTELTSRQTKKSEPKIMRHYEDQEKQPASGDTCVQTGNTIIKNMDLNRPRSKSPERKRPMIPDGKKIIQNMELSHNDFEASMRSTASQTSCSASSSPRSASPETEHESIDIPDGRRIVKNMEFTHGLDRKTKSVQRKQIPNGEKITQNLELSSRDSSFKTRSESSQTSDIPDGMKIVQNMEPMNMQRGNISIGVQTFDENDIEEEGVRSVPVQTDLNLSDDNFSNGSIDFSHSRSIAVQTQTLREPAIPDGSKITKNMESHKSEKTKQFTDSRDDKKSLNDSNWNEFVRHLELFNPSQSSSSSASVSEEEIPSTQTSEPILVYDRNAPSPETIKTTTDFTQKGISGNKQRVSDRSAGAFLKSEAYTKHQYESILREEGLLPKYDTSLKSTVNPSVRAKLMVENAFSKNEGILEKSDAKKLYSKSTFSKGGNDQLSNQQGNRLGQKQVSQNCKNSVLDTGTTFAFNMNHQHDQKQTNTDKENLGFTPIETYSFNPETLMKTASKRACAPSKRLAASLKPQNGTTASILSSSPTFSTKESVTKNSFIQGLDLGPVPKTLTSQRQPPHVSSSMISDRADTYKTNFSRGHDKYGNGLSEKPNYQESFVTSSFGNSRSSATTKPSPQPSSLSGYQSSAYSHVTGHSSRAYLTDYRSSFSQSRPSSAPTTSSRGYTSSRPLSSTLRDMRNNALRKNATNQFADQRKRSPALAKSSSFSAPTRRSYVDQNTMSRNSLKYSMHDYQRSHENFMQHHPKSTSGYMPSTHVSQNSYHSKETATGSLHRNTSPLRSDYMYLSALNDQSNARPPSRERSRSRSRSPAQSPTPAFSQGQYDVPKHHIQETDTLSVQRSARYYGDEMNRYKEIKEDRGSFDSTASSGFNQSYSRSPGSTRESRPLTRKPPLPRTPRSSSNGRSRSSSADSLSRKRVKPPKDVKKENQHTNTANTAKPNPVKRENRPMLDKYRQDENFDDLRTVTIGDVPSGLADSKCFYLGHDTIQKIIEEAKL